MASVRGAIAAYFNTATPGGVSAPIPTLNKVYRAMPTFIDPARWWQLPVQLGEGTIGYLHLAEATEDRDSLPAVTGSKMVGYTVALVLIYRYLIPSGSQAVALDGDEWVDELDACLEGIKALIRLDPNLGTSPTTVVTGQPGVVYSQFPGAVWQAGQDKADLRLQADLPARDEDAGEVLAMQILEFHAYEVIEA